jgi:uncharacterized protein (DUF1697 family)
MSRYVAFLRGMNVGGHRLTNDELRGHFLALGFTDVATFRASGNVVFAGTSSGGESSSPRGDPSPAAALAAEGRSSELLAARIEEGLESLLGYAVPTFVRGADEVRAIAALQPFAAERVAASGGKLQVSLLGASPTPEVRAEVLSMATGEDGLSFGASSPEGERELYWLPSGGLLESELDLKAIDRLLGPSTMRTKGTIELIARKHCE